MFTPVLFLSALVSVSIAQSSTASVSGPVVSIFLPDTDSQKLVASVIGSSGAMTTYVITCPEGTDQNDCGYNPPITVTANSESVHITENDPEFTASIDCTLQGITAGVCVESFGGSSANFPGLDTTTLSAADITLFPVTITAGSVSGSESGSASSTSASASASVSTSTASATSTSASASSSASGTAATTGSNTGGADRSLGVRGLQLCASFIGPGLVGLLWM